MTTKTEESPYSKAMKWAAAQDIKVQGVAPTEIPGLGLGMIATRVIEVSLFANLVFVKVADFS